MVRMLSLIHICQGNWEYDIVAPSYKCNMTDIQAAIGLVQLDRYDAVSYTHLDVYKRQIMYRTHVQDIGWTGWKTLGQYSGTSCRAKQVEAIEIKLTGDVYKRQAGFNDI